jgi:glycolate oxidase iron-sulfur subunit
VLDAVGVQVIVADGSGCCGAIRQHLDDQDGARANCRRNIDAWWPFIESGEAEAILINASGCGAMVKEYGHLLRDDPAYAAKASRIVEQSRDLAEFLPGVLAAARVGTAGPPPATAAPPPATAAPPPGTAGPPPGPGEPPPAPAGPATARALPAAPRVAFHSPCTLQHGLKVRGDVEKLLISLGAQLLPVADSHLCCGSAGTYSLLQTELSQELRTRKLDCLLHHEPDVILSANIGCIGHLQGATGTPVRHWIEWVDAALGQP